MILLNPGGPGASGVDEVLNYGSTIQVKLPTPPSSLPSTFLLLTIDLLPLTIDLPHPYYFPPFYSPSSFLPLF